MSELRPSRPPAPQPSPGGLLPAVPGLTAYEAAQAEAIAAWKGEQPDAFRRFVRGLAQPWVNLVHDLVPEPIVRSNLGAMGRSAGRLAAAGRVPALAGYGSVRELRGLSLERADALADRVIRECGQVAAGAGATLALGGVVTLAAVLPAMLLGALQAIYQVGHCYGYPLDGPDEADWVLGILVLSTAATRKERLLALQSYQRLVEADLIHGALENHLRGLLERALFGKSLASLVPGVGIVLNAGVHHAFVVRAGIAAKRVMQERRLRDGGKLRWIEPA